MPPTFNSLDLLRDLLRDLHPQRAEPVRALADCEDCGQHKPCRGYPAGPLAPDGGSITLWVCDECRAEHETLEVTP